VPLLAFVSQAVPALAGLVAGTTIGRWFTDDDGGSVLAGLTGIVSGVVLGVAAGLLVWIAGGTLGDGAMAQVGAPPLATAIQAYGDHPADAVRAGARVVFELLITMTS